MKLRDGLFARFSAAAMPSRRAPWSKCVNADVRRVPIRACVWLALFVLAPIVEIGPSHAIPVDARPLTGGEFFATQDIWKREHDWMWGGMLEEFNRSWRDGHFFQARSVRGRRFSQHSDTAYQLQFRGMFPRSPTNVLWSDNLLTHNDHKSDPGETIPEEWRSGSGYAVPVDRFAAFERKYALRKTIFDVGQFGCPSRVPGTSEPTDHCIAVEPWFAGSLRVEANLEAVGDISIITFADESVTSRAKADRVTEFRVNDQTLLELARIDSPDVDLTVDDSGQLRAVNLKWSGTFGSRRQEVTTEGSTQWEGRPAVSDVDANYSETATIDKFLIAELSNEFVIEILDDPFLLAGITGSSFTRATVFAGIAASMPMESHKLVALAVPVPEPTALALFGTGLLGLLGYGWRHRKLAA